ncbi:MAG: UDP-3-O-(3-hydroxymyristoyl)glucosamine N-acyltransferase [Candidatus Marinimicrobia bacterium]|nr:UDP-3-O-(3-hydroxymyristoyl)glucosamine N-acyltransferase [Candidatus Neomarinimicrobiota bacterium]
MTFTLKELSELVGGELLGDPRAGIKDVAEIQNAMPGEITFLGNDKYRKFIKTTEAEAIIVHKDFDGEYKNLIKVDNVNLAFSLCLSKLRPQIPKNPPSIHKTAIVAKTAILGNDIFIGPHVVIEDHAVIENGASIYANCYVGHSGRVGANTLLYPNVTLYHKCIVGENNIIHSGTVIGSDGYGFVRKDDTIEKIPQTGKVVIKKDVEIGSNCSIDRGTIGDTVIGKGTKLDNHIQVGHNVKIGKYCFIAGQTGIAGSTTIGDYVTIAGQVGIGGHIEIGSRVVIGAKSGISKSIPEGEFWFGYPASPYKVATRQIASIRMIPEMKERLREIEKLINKKDL